MFGSYLGAQRVSVGLHFGYLGVSGAPFRGHLGSILGALGPSWAPRGTLGAHKSPHGRPEANFGFILESFWLHFGGQNWLKIRANFRLTFLSFFL